MKRYIAFGVLFLILIGVSSVAFAQAQEKNQSAYKFFQYEKLSNSLLKEKFEDFDNTLQKDSSSQGYIINYGTEKEIAKREKQLRNLIVFRRYDESRITFVRGGKIGKSKSVFWIVPAGTEPPKP